MARHTIGAWTLSTLLLGGGLAIFGSGCEDGRPYYVDYRAPVRQQRGAVRFTWSIASQAAADSDDADAGASEPQPDAGLASDAGLERERGCKAVGADQFQALLFDQGTIVYAAQASCAVGSAVVHVGSNDYSATAALVDARGVPVTQTEVVPQFVVAPGETQSVMLTFKPATAAP